MTTHAAYIDLDEGAAPATPAAGKVRVYAKADGLPYSKDDAGAESGLASAGGGGGFAELASLKDTAGAGDLTTTSTSFVDVTGASVTLTTAAVRCLVLVSTVVVNSNAGQSVCVDVAIDGTRMANTTNGIAAMIGTNWVPLNFVLMTDVLSAASHTFKIQWRVSGNTGGMKHQTTTNPIYLQVIETTLAV